MLLSSPLIILFFFVAGVQLFYWLFLLAGFRRACRPGAGTSGEFLDVSVIVAARNEETNLPALRRSLSAQDHPRTEVIVADDASDDRTPQYVQEWAAENGNVRHVRITVPEWPRKKNALTRAIDAARGTLLIFTDADCRPGPHWVSSIAARYGSERNGRPVILVGYGPYASRPGLLNRLVRYETLVTAFLTAGAIGLKRPYMAVGRNLSYPRQLFSDIGGFEHSMASLSGDDDLFVQHAAAAGLAEVRYVSDPESFVVSDPPGTWRQWVRQKTRHNSAGRFYRTSIKLHLALFQLTGILIWMAPFLLGWTGLALWGARQALQFAALSRAARTLHEPGLIVLQPLLDLLYTLYNVLIVPLGLFRMPKRW